MRKELPPPRTQRRDLTAMTEQREPHPAAAEALGHVAVVDEKQLEQSPSPGPLHRQPAGLEPSHDPAPNVEDDDDPDSQPEPDAVHPDRPRREEHERRVVSGRSAPRRRRAHLERGLRARSDPEPARP